MTMTENTYEIIANAKVNSSEYKIVSTVGQKIYLATIPLFQFAIFYQGDMEIAPGAAMSITGPVHGNRNIYNDPNSGVALTFYSPTGAVGQLTNSQSPNDPRSRSIGPSTFNSSQLSDQPPLNVPVGTNTFSTNDPSGTNIYALLQVPQAGQGYTDTNIGTNLLFNQADLIIIVSNNNTISVTSGAWVNNQATVISNNQWQNFISTNGAFTDQRDSLTVNPVVINVSNLVNWSATNTALNPTLSSLRSGQGNVQSIYIADLRSTSNSAITTNANISTNFSTNTVTTGSYPLAGTYVAPVTTNTSPTTNSSSPSAGTYVGSVTTLVSNTTTSSSPAAGTYTGSITTDVTAHSSTTKPATGTYVGSYTNHSGTYSYALITGYTYNLITGYSYTAITGYTYGSVATSYATNYSFLTNWSITSQPGIVLSNGAVLPPQGLAVATPDPAYVVGNWNIKTNNSGSSDAGLNSTAYTYPSAIYADAVTILSPSWNPANSALAIGSRTATSDTVNAAIMTGNVPSDGQNYSGGVENFMRFLESWSGDTLTYNGSLVCLFSSQIANAPWPGTGTVYNPPTRDWSFDNNFNNPAKQPPLTPKIRTVMRSQWTLLAPYATSF